MKLNFLSAGRLRMKKSIYIPSADRSETIDLPVSSALIRHKQGNVLFDTGCHPSVVDNAEERWGPLAKIMKPLMTADETLLPSLACVGLGPDDIDIVVNSHFHPDHCGCNQFFTKATIWLTPGRWKPRKLRVRKMPATCRWTGKPGSPLKP
jgi:N-acyl homoserine lactone hydrolase